MTSALNMPKPLIMPPATSAIRSSGPPINWATSAQAPVSQALAVGWGFALNLGFERLVTLDIMIYGASLALEFLALIVLRIREPKLKRPFRVPGGLFGAIAVGIPPVLLLGFAIIRSEHEVVLGMSSFLFGMILIGAGVVAYLINHAVKPAGWAPAEPKSEMAA